MAISKSYSLKKWALGTVIALSVCSFSLHAKTLRVGMETTFAPFEYYNEQNELVGFDVDIANRICEILQETCQFQNLPFESLIGSLKMRKIDMAVSGIDITPARQAQVDFSTPYYENTTQYFIVTQENKGLTLEQLQQEKIGVQNGTTQQHYLQDTFPETEISSYTQVTMALADLKNKRITAVLTDAAVADEMVKADPSLSLMNEKIVDPSYFGVGMGIAIRQGNTQLLQNVEKALAQMQSDGSYQKIYDKWFHAESL